MDSSAAWFSIAVMKRKGVFPLMFLKILAHDAWSCFLWGCGEERHFGSSMGEEDAHLMAARKQNQEGVRVYLSPAGHSYQRLTVFPLGPAS